jgi:hypothetical protein
MKTNLAITLTLIIIVGATTVSSGRIILMSNAIAKQITHLQDGHDNSCSDLKLPFTAGDINQPNNDKAPASHTRGFMSGSNTGSSTCGDNASPTSQSSHIPSSSSPLLLLKEGYAKGVLDATTKQSTSHSGTMHADDVDCDSDIDPRASNEDYCSGYQHGFADTHNALSNK